MTNTLKIMRGDKVLEIGTGSGYQSAYLSNLTPMSGRSRSSPPLSQRTRALYDRADRAGYSEYRAIGTRNADGYYGWAGVSRPSTRSSSPAASTTFRRRCCSR